MSAPFVVAAVCRAEEHLGEAQKALIQARLDIEAIDRTRPAERPDSLAARQLLDALASRAGELGTETAQAVRQTAALIQDPASS